MVVEAEEARRPGSAVHGEVEVDVGAAEIEPVGGGSESVVTGVRAKATMWMLRDQANVKLDLLKIEERV